MDQTIELCVKSKIEGWKVFINECQNEHPIFDLKWLNIVWYSLKEVVRQWSTSCTIPRTFASWWPSSLLLLRLPLLPSHSGEAYYIDKVFDNLDNIFGRWAYCLLVLLSSNGNDYSNKIEVSIGIHESPRIVSHSFEMKIVFIFTPLFTSPHIVKWIQCFDRHKGFVL